ncbi:MAG: DUF6578 domain-containing protein [Muribaculaceae bacterium]
MKTRIKQCNILYDSWQMQSCGDPIHVGQVVNLSCIKDKPYTPAFGVEVDFIEEHHGGGANCLIRGKVNKIRSVFVDRFANMKDGIRYIDDPDNTFAIIEVDYIDGWEKPICYGERKGDDVCYYIITLENAIECTLERHDNYPLYQGLYVKMEPDDDSKSIFWNEGGSQMGTIDELTIYKDDKSRKIDLTTFCWHNDLIAWHKFYQENISDGYKTIDNVGWLKWWSKGWGLAKEIRKLLPEDIELNYGYISQAVQVLEGTDLNTGSLPISFPKHMQNRIDEGLYIPNAYVDWEVDEDEHGNYMFNLNGYEHDIHPNDRIMLGVYGRPQYQTGTVKQSSPTGLLIHTDWQLDISESYSIELIL